MPVKQSNDIGVETIETSDFVYQILTVSHDSIIRELLDFVK